jgi:hypothetical protein
MSVDQELLNLAGAESESQTLFDELAGLVPAERLAEYYRVIAHTRTLSPNDEMPRLLEAMGVLALLTRETPAEIAAKRKSLRKILESSASQANAVEKRMAGYASHLTPCSVAQGIRNRVGPASNCKAAGRESATVFPAIRFAGYRQSAWPVPGGI